MHHFILTSRWRLHASAEQVWALLTAIEDWPSWWRYVRSARIESRGGPDRLGDVARIDWGSALAYGVQLRVTTTLAERPSQLEGRAEGDLHGRGLWLIEPADAAAVDVTYRWDVELRRPWMRRLAPLLRPLFEWNHFVVMRAGARGMAERLGCRLSELREWSGAVR